MSPETYNFPPYVVLLSSNLDKLETGIAFSGVKTLIQALVVTVKADVSADCLFVHTANSDFPDSASLIC